MRGKVVNLCLGFLNLLFGIMIVLFTIKVPQNKTLLTVQEQVVVNYMLIGIYAVMGIIAFIDFLQSINHKADTTFNVGYILGIFVVSFVFIKQPFVGAFSIISGLIVLTKSLKENLIELDSTTAISISIVLMGATIILGIFTFSYTSFGERIKNKENKGELKYKSDYFRYITELEDSYSNFYINVKKDGKFGYINSNGEVVIDYIYDYASPFVKIKSYDKTFYVALVCEEGSSYLILKNQRKILSYRSESADDNYEAKIEELKDIYENTLKQTEPMEFEIVDDFMGKNRVPKFEDQQDENISVFDYSNDYNLIVTKSTTGRNDIYELSKKDNSSERITLNTTNLDYDDKYLYLFSNGYIPFYEISKATQGWFTNYGKKVEITGKAHILELFDDERLIIQNLKDNSIYFSTITGERLSDSYFDIYICGNGRYIVRDGDNYFKVIDDEYNAIFEKKYAVIHPRFVRNGLYLVLNSTDDIKFNDYGYATMNWTILNYNGEEIATNIEYIYDLDLKVDKKKKIDEENYLLFVADLKKLNCDFVGEKFYNKDE